MCIRHIVVLVAATLVTLTSVPGALGTVGPLQISNEATGDPCPAVSPSDSSEFPAVTGVSGGCPSHVTSWEGSISLIAHMFGVEISDGLVCDQEHDVRLGSDGEGYFTNIALTGPDCDRQPCRNASGVQEAWEIHAEELSAGAERIEAHWCLEDAPNGGNRTGCHLLIPFGDTSDHVYELGTSSASDDPHEIPCEGFDGFRWEFSGYWETEDSGFEATHP